MIYKNYISGKNLSGLNIYVSIFLLAVITTVGQEFFSYYFFSFFMFFVNYDVDLLTG